ncbi:MAG: hypothetical protein PHE53_01035 [Thermoguttaceae bacterium]|nr:hypothetical protein [Thermoguttaceae bacterium]
MAFSGESMPLVNPEHASRLPEAVDGKKIASQLGCWFMHSEQCFEPNGYRPFLDTVASRGAFDILCASARLDNATAPQMVEMFDANTRYAEQRYGVHMILDLDMRMARREFAKRYPHALQERLQLEEKPLQPVDSSTNFTFTASELTDHYTGDYPYTVQGARLVRVWSYQKDSNGMILKDSVRDISSSVEISISQADKIELRVPSKAVSATSQDGDQIYICASVAFSFLYADVFAPETIPYEQALLHQYQNVQAIGAWKDEWGFPPSFDGVPAKNEYWYSEAMRAAYAKANSTAKRVSSDGGVQDSERDLIDDCLVMYRADWPDANERIAIIDAYNRLCFDRHVEIETQFYRTTKEVFGSDALVGVHSTWFPVVGRNEFKKNGLTWWAAPRDYAQTDESTPYYCRTSIAKKTNSIWYNMYYSSNPDDYVAETWSDVLAGGRVNIHPIYPTPEGVANSAGFRVGEVLDTGVDIAMRRIRMLNFAGDAPLYSPIAVVFDHFGVMNWAKPEYDQVGQAIAICDALAAKGYPVDLIPSSEVMTTDSDGKYQWKEIKDGQLKYGVQKYSAVLLVTEPNPALSNIVTNRQSLTSLVLGQYTTDTSEISRIQDEIVQILASQNIQTQTPWSKSSVWNSSIYRPARRGMARLIDGTILWVSAMENAGGDPISMNHEVVVSHDGQTQMSISAEVTGLMAIRFNSDGQLNMLTASNLRKFSGGGIEIDLTDWDFEMDVALWKDTNGQWRGVFQAKENSLPKALSEITHNWRFLAMPQ